MSSKEASTDFSICGTKFEGGGGLIRDAMTYSSILNRSLLIYDIRANRPGAGGLRVEHVTAIDTMARLSHAEVEGNTAHSRHLVFRPQSVTPNQQKLPIIRSGIDIVLEGSASIALVALLPYTLFSNMALNQKPHTPASLINKDGMSITIRGGTLCIKAPSIHYLRQVWLPTMKMIGLGDHIQIYDEDVQGWHTEFVSIPGKITAKVVPLEKSLNGFELKRRGVITLISAIGTAPKRDYALFQQILEFELRQWFTREHSAAQNPLIDVVMHETTGKDCEMYHLLLSAHFTAPEAHLGFEDVYPRQQGFPEEIKGKPREIMLWLTRSVVKGLKLELRKGHSIDEQLQNMLVPYMALAKGWSSVWSSGDAETVAAEDQSPAATEEPDSKYEISDSSLHYETAEWVASTLTGVTFRTVDGRYGCNGIGIGSASYDG